MGFLSGLFHSRDKPTNSTNGSSYRFLFGGSNSDKAVNERSAMQMTTVYACVRILSGSIAGLPVHVYKYTDSGSKEKGGDTMANTSAVYARIDTNLKDNAESILSQLGISPSSAIQMLYSQIVLKKGMPFELKLPSSKPLAVGAMTREELDAELQKGVDSIKEGKVYSADEVDAVLAKEFGI